MDKLIDEEMNGDEANDKETLLNALNLLASHLMGIVAYGDKISEKSLYPRVQCCDGISLSIQANKRAYCMPRIDDIVKWHNYSEVEVGLIQDTEGNPITPPESWRPFADGSFPNEVYGYVPTEKVQAFIEDHGGEVS